MPRERPEGICHLCGEIGPLSFEHIPPEKAFNNRPIMHTEFEAGFSLERSEYAPYRIEQRGLGAYTLCAPCNNMTGKWYGNEFVEWSYRGMALALKTETNASKVVFQNLRPLRVIKQIWTMAFSANTPQWSDANTELRDFVLDRDRVYLAPRYRAFAYLNREGRPRVTGEYFTLVKLYEPQNILQVSEIAIPPFGYVLTTNGTNPDDRLFEISHFARYEVDERTDLALTLLALPTHLGIPLDYRTYDEIVAGRDLDQPEP